MQKSGRRSAGIGRNAVVAAFAVGVLIVAGFWPSADATPSQAGKLDALIRSPIGDNRRRAAIDQLSKLDSDEARTKLKALADSPDDRVAVLAIGALCRADFSGAEAQVKSVFEDAHRSDLARGMALVAYCEARKKHGSSWTNIKSYVKQKAGNDRVLKDQYAASKAKLWASEVDNDQ